MKTVEKKWEEFIFITTKRNSQKISSVQYSEMKKTFYAACGIMLDFLKMEVSELSEDEGVLVLEEMSNEVRNFWEEEFELFKRGKNNI